MAEGKISDDGNSVIFTQPLLEGTIAQVQHGLSTGRAFTDTPGTCGCGVVTLPTGQPRVILQVKHSDGTTLAVIMGKTDAQIIADCLSDAMERAQAIADTADKAVRQ